MGSEREAHNFIFDTGSPWLWIATTECGGQTSNCHTSDLYDTGASTYYARVSNQVQDLNYEIGKASGYIAKDKVCLSRDDQACVDEFLFVEVHETVDLDGLRSNGVLGLSPSSTDYNMMSGSVMSNSYMQNLKQTGIIDEMVFSLYISIEDEQSAFTAGGYDIDRFAPGETLTWNPLTDTDYWRVDLEKAVIGEVKVLTSTDSAIIDSGTTFVAMPDYDLESLV